MAKNSNFAEKNRNFSEFETKAILRDFGIETPRGMIIREFPERMELNYPLVLKVSDPKILHKSDVGGVKLGIRDIESLKMSFKEMKTRFPDSDFMLEETAPAGVEFIAGVVRDPVFGHVLMLGTGGIYTELFKDVVFRKIPVEKEDAVDMIGGIKSGKFCKGFRGIKVDCDLLVGFLIKISNMVASGKYDIESLDINPIIASEHSVVAVDAKLSVS